MTTPSALDHDYPLRSQLSQRAPTEIALDEQVQELRVELDARLTYYPRRVAKNAMSADTAERHIAAWRAILADHDGDALVAATFDWTEKVRELRRELDFRRAVYPKWIAQPGHPLSATEATRKLERLDAIHWRYWVQMAGAMPVGVDPRTWLPRLAHIARMEAARARRHAQRRPDAASADRAAAARWTAIATLAEDHAGDPPDWRPVDTRAPALSAFVLAQLTEATSARKGPPHDADCRNRRQGRGDGGSGEGGRSLRKGTQPMTADERIEVLNLYRTAHDEIVTLRRRLAEAEPKAHAYDTIAAIARMKPEREQGYSVDVAWRLKEAVEKIEAERAAVSGEEGK